MAPRPGWPTDPEVLAFIAETAAHYPRDVDQNDPAAARRAYDNLCDAFAVPHPLGVETTDSVVTAARPKRDIPIRTYTNEDEPSELDIQTEDVRLRQLFSGEQSRTTTCLMYLHGGGWTVGDLESHDSICAEICAAADIDVVAVDYRLCPEHRHPAALDDAEAVYRQLIKSYTQVLVGGDSAGGHLAAAVCLRLRGKRIMQPSAQLLIYPALGAVPKGGSYVQNARAPGLTTADVLHYWRTLADGDHWQATDDAELAPLRAKDVSKLPPAIITSAGCDPLRDDAIQYAQRLTEAGVPVVWRNDPQLVHGHLRARFMSGIAMANFLWTCSAINEIAMQAAMEDLLNDPDFATMILDDDD